VVQTFPVPPPGSKGINCVLAIRKCLHDLGNEYERDDDFIEPSVLGESYKVQVCGECQFMKPEIDSMRNVHTWTKSVPRNVQLRTVPMN
jgi:hypothetical protein